jgi:predicted DNA-binding transcriptional regulator AlpA
MERVLPSLVSSLLTYKRGLTVKQFADIIGISGKSVYDAIKEDGLPMIRFRGSIRIDPVHAAEWLRARQVRPR